MSKCHLFILEIILMKERQTTKNNQTKYWIIGKMADFWQQNVKGPELITEKTALYKRIIAPIDTK